MGASNARCVSRSITSGGSVGCPIVARRENSMKRVFALASVLTVTMVLAGTGVGADDKEKPASIADVMAKAHDKKEGLIILIKTAVKDKDWEAATTKAKE